tara:strand:+ start:211 stop:897 length:687 start_codon:yes stop_codon:yes gene_type:complete
MKNKIFIACDSSKINNIKKIINSTHTDKINIGYKFGLEFFYSRQGREYISKLKNKLIWLDLKLFDIPNTVSSSIYSLKDLKNLRYITIHISGGLEMMLAAKMAAKKINKNLKVLGVTILTSFSEKSLKKTGHTKSIEKLVTEQVVLAKSARLDGIVCSGHEAKIVKKKFKGEIITPGIRLPGDSSQDQKRVINPKRAFQNGATSIVIGRSITRGNIKNNIQKLINSLK